MEPSGFGLAHHENFHSEAFSCTIGSIYCHIIALDPCFAQTTLQYTLLALYVLSYLDKANNGGKLLALSILVM